MLVFLFVEMVCSAQLPELTFDTALATVASFDLDKLESFADAVQLSFQACVPVLTHFTNTLMFRYGFIILFSHFFIF